MGRTEPPERGSTAAHMSLMLVNHVEQRIVRKQFGTERTVVSTGRAFVDHGAASGKENSIGTGSAPHPPSTFIVVDRAK